MEQIALDMGTLLGNALPTLTEHRGRLRIGGLVTKMRTGGQVLFEGLGEDAWSVASKSESDSVRGWGAMAIGHAPGLDLDERLRLIRPYADDAHFAVREWAWLSLRPHIAMEPRTAIHKLGPWTSEESDRLRRFATEASRPRGVWSAHISLLKAEPELGLPLLLPLKSDPSRYVQDSVANWLNDASKSQSEWVEQLCRAWLANASDHATIRICRRGMRSISRVTGSAIPGSSTPVP
jgi:3-methyladenine DNA glycosylase AlkC